MVPLPVAIGYRRGFLAGAVLVCASDTFLRFASFINNTSGEKLVNFLVEPKKGTKWPSDLPRFKTRQEAIAVCKELCDIQFIHRSEKRGKGDLVVS